MDTKNYKKELENKKEKLDNLVTSMKDNTLFGDTTKHTSEKYASGELSSYDNHIGDLGTDVFMQNMQNSLTIHEEGRLEQVTEALSKIEEGTYGICEICKKRIGTARLELMPETTLCAQCAKKKDSLPDDNENPDRNIINEKGHFYSDYLTNLTDLNKNSTNNKDN